MRSSRAIWSVEVLAFTIAAVSRAMSTYWQDLFGFADEPAGRLLTSVDYDKDISVPCRLP